MFLVSMIYLLLLSAMFVYDVSMECCMYCVIIGEQALCFSIQVILTFTFVLVVLRIGGGGRRRPQVNTLEYKNSK